MTKVIKRSAAILAGLLVVVMLVAAVVVFTTTRRPLPQTSGTIDLPGLSGPVEVVRDELGIPNIYASKTQDLFFAQGFVHAQDRFFEMDYRRHLTAGRLAELVGNVTEAVEADQVIRTFGWRRVAEQEWEILDPETREAFTSYAAGVNAYLNERSAEEIALEYTVLGLQGYEGPPEPWTELDSLTWLKAMAWDLRGNFDEEIERTDALASLGNLAHVAELFPAYDDVRAPILFADDSAAGTVTQVAAQESAAPEPAVLETAALEDAVLRADVALNAVPATIGQGEGIGSNSWVIAPEHTESGAPLLANDPHLTMSQPGIWYQVGLHCINVGPGCDYEVSGFSFAGLPGVMIGRNSELAWGFTNLGADVMDLYVHEVRDGQYKLDDGYQDLGVVQETIKVRGGDDINLEVRYTHHGPIISDVLGLDAAKDFTRLQASSSAARPLYEVAIAWTALTPGHTADAIFALNRAQNAEDIARGAALFEAPAQNIVFATASGDIGYQAPGKIPVRSTQPLIMQSGERLPTNGTWPMPGWDSAFDWQGFVAPEDLPAELNPARGYIVAANQAVLPAGSEPFLTEDWDYGMRSDRIQQQLIAQIEAGEKISIADTAVLQNDQHAGLAPILVPYLLDIELAAGFESDGQRLLADWDHLATPDSAAAAYFAAVWQEVLFHTFSDELEDAPTGGSRYAAVMENLLADPDSHWWDDISTFNVVETRDEILQRSLVNARLELTRTQGQRTDDWAWGQLHTATPAHGVLGGDSIPGLIRNYFNSRTLPAGGDGLAPQANAWHANTGSYEVITVPSMRMIVDLSLPDGAQWVSLTGNSGHPASGNYSDQFAAWAAGDYFNWAYSYDAVVKQGKSTLLLLPPGFDG